MNKIIHHLIGQTLSIEVSGKNILNGILIDAGNDVIVLFNGIDFVYIPLLHIQNFKISRTNEYQIMPSTEPPTIETEDDLSLRKVLTSAKGMFTEIYVTGNQRIQGYITSIMNNYFVFNSPVYKTMFITLNHLKWLIPYSQNQKPYGLSNKDLPYSPSNISLARTFDVQLEKLIGELVIFNIGEHSNFIGKLNNIEDNIIELRTAREDLVYLNLQHIKTVHQA
ncbi:DUF2642 domain-containing protein [Peribacillus tepidiphilus]|uniref:DUF2642 domain-containing protein n=1 Tax=Peribacillus tepidiphilus TaxID=2652445 RepID=UPI001291CC2D|nr:DUF2642 domain-containing protein [Peribacillus tepidiphilus]